MTVLTKKKVKKMFFEWTSNSKNTYKLMCFDNGNIFMINDNNILIGLSNVMFNAGLKTSYQGEADALKKALREVITDYSDENAEKVVKVLRNITKIPDWKIVKNKE